MSGFGDRDHCDGVDEDDGVESVTRATTEGASIKGNAEGKQEGGEDREEDKLGYFSSWISHEERALLGRSCKVRTLLPLQAVLSIPPYYSCS